MINIEKLQSKYREIEKIEKNKSVEITPSFENAFRAFEIPVAEIRIVILGQDPYHQKRDGKLVANGLSFSADRVEASLRNVYKVIGETSMSGDLTRWLRQGVMLLNTALTTAVGAAGAHLEIWQPLIVEILVEIFTRNEKCVIFAWGNFAKNIATLAKIPESRQYKHCHPSPLTGNAFMDCRHFSDYNVAHKHFPICWVDQFVDVYTDGSCKGNGKKISASRAGIFVPRQFRNFYKIAKLSTVVPAVIDADIVGKILDAVKEKCIAENHHIVKYTTREGKLTNNRAEGFAMLLAIAAIERERIPNARILSDSELWCKTVSERMYKWHRVNDTTKKNPDIWRLIYEIKTRHENKFGKIVIQHIYGHGKNTGDMVVHNYGNDRADYLTNIGIQTTVHMT